MSASTIEVPLLTYESVVDRIRIGILRGKGVSLPAEDITAATGFWAGAEANQPCLYLDSIDFLELVVFLEQEYGWTVPEVAIDIHDLRTVGDLATLVMKYVA